jgi:pilus assembly protein CpaC
MNAKTDRLAHPSRRREARVQRSGAGRFALTVLLGAMGAFMGILPTAEAEGVRGTSVTSGMVASQAPLPSALPSVLPSALPSDAPLTVAASGPIRLTIGAADPAPVASMLGGAGKGPNCTGPVGDHETVVVPLGKSTMVNLREPVRQRTVGNPAVVQTMLVSPTTLYVLGSDIGTTNMIVQGKSGSCSVIDVMVGADPSGLQQMIALVLPNERGVQVTAAGDSLVLTGTASDTSAAQRIVELAHAFTQRANAPLPAPSARGAAPLPAAGGAAPGGGDKSYRVINMMHIAAPQQVMLEVKVAEVSKTLIDQLGAQANLQGSIGTWSFGLLAQFLSGGLGAVAASKANNLPLNFAVDAQKTDQLVKILAEPNLMAISGQEASFLAGGKVFIPVPQSNGTGGSTIVLQEEQFGVGLTFTPTVLENGRINLKVAPEVSELSPTGVTVTAPGTSGAAILPLITTRRATTTLQVYDGQSFAIGGLLKSNVTGTIKALPGAGELPVLGALFRSTNYQSDKTELVFVVTPRLAKPLPRVYPLPTDTFANVSEGGVYATGNMEGTKPAAPVAPVSGVPAATSPSSAGVPAQPAARGQGAAPSGGAPASTGLLAPDPAPKGIPSGDPGPGTDPAAQAARPAGADGPISEPLPAQRIDVQPLPAQPAAAPPPTADTASTGAGAPASRSNAATPPPHANVTMTASRDASRAALPPVMAH